MVLLSLCDRFCRHLPVGVLFDLFGRGGSLPWNVTVHFKVHVHTWCHIQFSAVYHWYDESLCKYTCMNYLFVKAYSHNSGLWVCMYVTCEEVTVFTIYSVLGKCPLLGN
jgi:hypothetical protein